MKTLDVMAHLSALNERAPVLVRVPGEDGQDRFHAVHSIDEDEGSEGLIAVLTLGPAVTP